jgi:hypothetical protein
MVQRADDIAMSGHWIEMAEAPPVLAQGMPGARVTDVPSWRPALGITGPDSLFWSSPRRAEADIIRLWRVPGRGGVCAEGFGPDPPNGAG